MGMKAHKSDTREQVPRSLARFDDRFGIVWRLTNAIRRVDPARTVRFVKAWVRPPTHRAPILIVGMPRSGTQMLFHLLRESPELGSMDVEGHDAWRAYHHPRRQGWTSDRVRAGNVRFGEQRFVNAWFATYTDGRRLLDKTADNLMRVPYLLELFPDAIFVVAKRNPCDVLNSYINMWRHPQGRFRSYFVPADLHIPTYPHPRRWCSTLIDGWRDLTTSPVPEIAFEQWRQYVERIEEGRRLVPRKQWVELSFEDLIATPEVTIAGLYKSIGIAPDAALTAKLKELIENPINSLSPPGHEKWRTQNAAEILELLPKIVGPAAVLGYKVDPATGAIP